MGGCLRDSWRPHATGKGVDEAEEHHGRCNEPSLANRPIDGSLWILRSIPGYQLRIFLSLDEGIVACLGQNGTMC